LTSILSSRAGGVTSDPVGYQATVRPRKAAVRELASGVVLTYRELDDRVARAAGWLMARLGDPSGQRVAMLGRNSIDLLVLSLACQRTGAIFVPLNWRLAGVEIAALVADCTPTLLVVDEEFAGVMAGPTVDLISTPDFAARAAGAAPRATLFPAPGTTIVLLYTSGTTGRPKGVIVTAENAFYAALNFALVGEVGPSTVSFSDLPMFHTIGLIAVARTTLMLGGTLVLADRFVPSRTLAALADVALGITHYFAVPVMVEALTREASFAPAAFRRLHAVFVGGAPLSPALLDRFANLGVSLVNGYGMSEAGTVMHVPIDPDAVRASPGAVGYPAPYIDVRLVGPSGDAEPGATGEVWLRGPSVTPGFWNQAGATEAAFSDGWYRTGDLAVIDPGGQYRIVDRLKDMYVSGGENVYPAEVEAVLLSDPTVADAAVIGAPDPRWGETGVAFIVPRVGTTVDPDRLAAFCATRLARYKCPSRIVTMAAIPRSAAGKILKPILREQLNRGVLT
jgi:fatty-acyl-CoA synthase